MTIKTTFQWTFPNGNEFISIDKWSESLSAADLQNFNAARLRQDAIVNNNATVVAEGFEFADQASLDKCQSESDAEFMSFFDRYISETGATFAVAVENN